MPPRSKTATSTPRLSEFARHFKYPAGITKTVWPRVEAKGKELGLGFDWWQSQLGTVCLGYGPGGKYVATVGGIGMSIPRQVGKTYFVLALLVIMCILFPGLQVVWTAHHLRTSTKTFTTLRGICRRRKVAPHIKPGGIRSANGEQQVEFTNGSMIMFGARSMGFGRGFDEVDIEVFDEAQILDTKALEDMIAATNQARHQYGALLFFMGTPPRPADSSEDFTARRSEALAGELDDAIWLEIGAEPGSDPDDRTQYPKMNPSYPKRTPLESILRLRKNLKNLDSWNREGRGIWDDASKVGGALPKKVWAELDDVDAARGSHPVFGADVAEDRTAWIAVAWRREDGDVQVMLANDGEALPAFQLVAECKRISDQWRGPVVGPKAFDAAMRRAKVRTVPMREGGFAEACGEFADLVTSHGINHADQEALNTAVGAVKWRPVGTKGEREWLLKGCPEIGPLVAATRAVYGLLNVPAPAAPLGGDATPDTKTPVGETAGLSNMNF